MTARRRGGGWVRLRAKVRERLVGPDDDGLDVFLSRLQVLANRVQPCNGIPADEVERQIRDWQCLLEGAGQAGAADVDDHVGEPGDGRHREGNGNAARRR